MTGIDILRSKLDQFIRKFYTNQLLRGLIYTGGLLLSFFLLALVLDYIGQFNSSGRTILFFSFLIKGILVLGINIIWPLLKMSKIIRPMNHSDAALMVGEHYDGVNDKILNTLQLAESNVEISQDQLTLVTASINQKIKELKPISFSAAIDFKENKKYLKYLIVPVLLFLGVYFIKSDIITEGTNRLMNYDDALIDQGNVPFTFEVQNEKLEVLEQEDFELKVFINEKKYTPQNVYIDIDGHEHKLKKINNKEFSYTFRNVQETTEFKLFAQEISSDLYELGTIPKPSLLGFEIEINYPEYTEIKDETIQNIGDLVIPEGSKVSWTFNTKNTNEISFRQSDSIIALQPLGANSFEIEDQFFESTNYSIATSNEFTTNKDSINYYITVTQDKYPSIAVEEKQDSSNQFIYYYNGNISDDYGFSKMNFVYSIINEEGKVKTSDAQSIAVSNSFNKDQFFHYFDLSTLGLEPGETVTYYFQVWDNDGINGAKSAKSASQTYKAPSLSDLMDQTDKASEEIKGDLQKNLDEAEALKKELDEIKKALLEKEKPDWQDKNKLENFLEKQKNLENNLEQMQLKNEQMQKENNQFNQQDQEILQKQEQLNKLFEELMDDEMKKLYEELEKMMEKMNKNQLLDKMDEIEMSQEEINKELDRALEQFKQLEYEQKLEDITKQLDELAEKQEELAEDTKEKEKSNFELNKEQEAIDKEFEKLQQEMDELEKLNNDLEDKNDMPDTDQAEQEINEEMENSQEQLGDNKNKKASESQQNAADKMKQMSQDMKDAQAQNQAEQAEEDMDALRQLLENLIDFSINQESVMEDFSGLNRRDPKYVQLGQDQRKLNDDAKMIEDSLYALSKRVLQLSPFINKEVSAMNQNLDDAIKYITERQTAMTRSKQQYVMTSVNNLALLFDEALQQMQQQAMSSKPGSGQCNKPGSSGQPGGKPKPMSMEQMKKQLEKQLAKMKGMQDKGEKPGGKDGKKPGQGQKPGEGQGQGGGMPGGQQMSKELAQMAAQQAALRKQIQQLSQELNKDGSGAGNGLKEIAKDLEKVEEDLVNGIISQGTINRQKDIMIRLLEHEKAQREQDWDDKRKSNEAINQKFSNPTEYLKYKEEKEKELELLKTIPPSLKPYYKNKVNEYFEQIER